MKSPLTPNESVPSTARSDGRIRAPSFEEEQGDSEQERAECPDCGRRFNVDRLPIHQKNCKSVFLSKRAPFVKGHENYTAPALTAEFDKLLDEEEIDLERLLHSEHFFEALTLKKTRVLTMMKQKATVIELIHLAVSPANFPETTPTHPPTVTTNATADASPRSATPKNLPHPQYGYFHSQNLAVEVLTRESCYWMVPCIDVAASEPVTPQYQPLPCDPLPRSGSGGSPKLTRSPRITRSPDTSTDSDVAAWETLFAPFERTHVQDGQVHLCSKIVSHCLRRTTLRQALLRYVSNRSSLHANFMKHIGMDCVRDLVHCLIMEAHADSGNFQSTLCFSIVSALTPVVATASPDHTHTAPSFTAGRFRDVTQLSVVANKQMPLNSVEVDNVCFLVSEMVHTIAAACNTDTNPPPARPRSRSNSFDGVGLAPGDERTSPRKLASLAVPGVFLSRSPAARRRSLTSSCDFITQSFASALLEACERELEDIEEGLCPPNMGALGVLLEVLQLPADKAIVSESLHIVATACIARLPFLSRFLVPGHPGHLPLGSSTVKLVHIFDLVVRLHPCSADAHHQVESSGCLVKLLDLFHTHPRNNVLHAALSAAFVHLFTHPHPCTRVVVGGDRLCPLLLPLLQRGRVVDRVVVAHDTAAVLTGGSGGGGGGGDGEGMDVVGEDAAWRVPHEYRPHFTAMANALATSALANSELAAALSSHAQWLSFYTDTLLPLNAAHTPTPPPQPVFTTLALPPRAELRKKRLAAKAAAEAEAQAAASASPAPMDVEDAGGGGAAAGGLGGALRPPSPGEGGAGGRPRSPARPPTLMVSSPAEGPSPSPPSRTPHPNSAEQPSDAAWGAIPEESPTRQAQS